MTDAEVILLITEIMRQRKEIKILYRVIATLQEKLKVKNEQRK